MRILEWIVKRATGSRANAVESPIGWMPTHADINWQGLEDFGKDDFHRAMSIDKSDWDKELLETDELFIRLYDRIPKEMIAIKDLMLSSMWRSPDHWEMTGDPT